MNGNVTSVTSLLDDHPAFTRQTTGGTFVVIQGPDRGEMVALRNQPISVGSSPSCDLVLSDKAVSRKHIVAEPSGQEAVVKDQGSTNGSFVAGSRFKEITVGYGAEIKLGRTVLKYLPEEIAVEPEASEASAFGALLGRDLKMRRLFNLLADVANTDAPVLIEGETGTGKELVAEELHNHSNRSNGPFVVFDCGAVPRELTLRALEGLLHRRGRRSQGRLRRGARRHHLPRRDRRAPARAPAVALARARQEGGQARRRQHLRQGRRAHRRRDQPRLAHAHRRQAVPRGPLLPARRHPRDLA